MSDFVDLINRHRKLIWKVCWMYGRMPQDRDDLFQEIVYRLWRAYPDFQGRSEFSTWLYRVALNTAITYDRQLRRKPEEALDERVDLAAPNAPDERIELFYRAMQSLNDTDRALLVMHLEGLTYEEIASVLGLTENHVGVKLNRAKNKLQQLVQGLT
jgi:RNA polymerase sigma-70 factor (ECF subfamily)